jgi:hypothetical protein
MRGTRNAADGSPCLVLRLSAPSAARKRPCGCCCLEVLSASPERLSDGGWWFAPWSMSVIAISRQLSKFDRLAECEHMWL